MRKTTFIYGLYCPIENKVKYIGKSNDPISRFLNLQTTNFDREANDAEDND